MATHQCNFQDEIMQLVKNSGETNQILLGLKEKFEESFKRQELQQAAIVKTLEQQQKEINQLKTFKNNIMAIAGVVGAIGAAILHFLGSFIHNWWINK